MNAGQENPGDGTKDSEGIGRPPGTTTSPEIPDDWFETTARKNFERAFLPASGMPGLRYLQIGVFTGNASVWLLENVLTSPSSMLVDVDTWDGGGSPELDNINFDMVEITYDQRMLPWSVWPTNGRVIKCKMSSMHFFADHIHNSHPPFDFIYIDGDHRAVSALEDGVMAYRCLKPGGVLCFDDYGWRSKHGYLHEPTLAVDVMKMVYADRLVVLRTGSQCWMKRVDAEVRR